MHMRLKRVVPLFVCFVLGAAIVPLTSYAQQGTAAQGGLRSPDVIFVPTPPEVVEAMLKVAKVGPTDVVYDLGSGDGRIVIAAAKLGARGIGIDIDPQRIKEANENAKQAGVTDRVRFLNQDLFETNFSEATVVTLYLLPSLNVKLRPKLLAELKPGTRIVSHAFDMGDWKPLTTLDVGGRSVYYWTVPPR
jgi:SAM-dependent methyltransferase